MCNTAPPVPRSLAAPPPSAPVPAAPPPDPGMRIGDRERDQVSTELRAHFTAGRVGVDEFSDRLDEALRASTAAELFSALRDLPPVPGCPRPWDRPGTVPAPGPVWDSGWAAPRWDGRRQLRPSHWRSNLAIQAARAHLRTYMTIMAFLVLIWALTGFGYFWPIWPIVFWGFFAVRHAYWAHQHERRRLDWS